MIQHLGSLVPTMVAAEAPAEFHPTPHQESIFQWVKEGSGSALVTAVAGAGKTTTIVEAMRLIPSDRKVLLLAFNKAIADELRTRTPPHVEARTFHSLGYLALRANGFKVQVDGRKLQRLFKDLLPLASSHYPAVSHLVSLAKSQGVGVLSPDTDSTWRDLAARYDVPESGDITRIINYSRKVLNASIESTSRTGLVDFDDQLYLPAYWELPVRQYDWVCVDEAQDINPIRLQLIRMSLNPGGRLVAVGDPCQSIYGFTGATPEVFSALKKEFDATELPLTVSFRCPQAVVRQAQSIVPYIMPHDSAIEGEVRHLDTTDLDTELQRLTAADVVLCRNTQPLVSTALHLIAAGVGCKVLGRDIGAGLVKLIEHLRPVSLLDLDRRLSDYTTTETAKLLARGEEHKVESLNDRVGCIRTVIDSLDSGSGVLELTTHLSSLFGDDNGTLTLSTIHKAKGREWNTVLLIRPDLLPSKWAKQSWQQTQERNLEYVAYTRAKRVLLIGPPGEQKRPSRGQGRQTRNPKNCRR